MIADWFNVWHQWLFEQIVQPALYQLGWMSYDEMAYDWTHLFLLGLIEVVLLWVLIRPLELWLPVERWPDQKATRIDVVYTLLARLGILPVVFFLALTPTFDWINSQVRLVGVIPPTFDNLLVYLVILDFADYIRHRLEHRFNIWWALHAVHHSQRQMTFWTDEREHLLGQLLAAAWRAAVGLLVGVPPAAFLTVTLVTAAIESFSHANVKLSFGWIGDRLVVSPLFHRVHHAIGIGHSGTAMGCNFASVLPVWDILFGTANFTHEYMPTGIEEKYGDGFWSQQWSGLKRMVRYPQGPGAARLRRG